MNQEIVVYIILAVTVGLTIYISTRKKRVPKVTPGNTNCVTDGCSGCALKDKCH
jgi:hypothetical protein